MASQTIRCGDRRRSGFTLIELLTVIGIIVILVGILIPVVKTVRVKAYESDTRALISKLAGGANNYYADFHAYPGPMPENMLYGYQPSATAPNVAGGTFTGTGGSAITSSENFLMGLLGGLLINTSSTAQPVKYDATLIHNGAKGPSSLNPGQPKQYNAYVTVTDKDLPPWDAAKNTYMKYGPQTCNRVVASALPTGQDSVIPEFWDHFTEPGPIIYLRARAGLSGMVNAGLGSPTLPNQASSQYLWQELQPYWWQFQSNPPTVKTVVFPTYDPPPVYRGGTIEADPSATILYNNPVDFFKHPTINDQVTPRGRDSFILMSGGADGFFGSRDDIIYSN